MVAHDSSDMRRKKEEEEQGAKRGLNWKRTGKGKGMRRAGDKGRERREQEIREEKEESRR